MHFTIGVSYSFDPDDIKPERFTHCASIGIGADEKIHRNEQRIIHCDEPVWGRYVALHVTNFRQMVLSVCELEIYGFDTCSE